MTIMLGLLSEVNKPAFIGRYHTPDKTMIRAASLLRKGELTIKEIAKICGVCHDTISKWGRGYVESFNQVCGWSTADVSNYRRHYTKYVTGCSRVHEVETMRQAAKMFNDERFSNRDVAFLLNVDSSSICRWRNGEVKLFNQVTGWK